MIFQDRGLAINSSLITEENDDKPYIYCGNEVDHQGNLV